jgi:hypothetical protein
MASHLIYLPKRNPKLSINQFITAWKEHSELGKSCLNVRKLIKSAKQCARIGYPMIEGVSEVYDGLAILSLADGVQSSDIWDDPEVLNIMKPDELRVFDDYVKNFTLEANCIFSKYPLEQSHQHCLIQLLTLDEYQSSEELTHELRAHLIHQSSNNESSFIKQKTVYLVTHQPSRQFNYDVVIATWFDSEKDALLFVDKKNLSASHLFAERFLIKQEIKLLLSVTHNRT